MSVENAVGLSKMPFETENNRRTERNVAVNLEQPAARTDWQGCEGILKATEGLCSSLDI